MPLPTVIGIALQLLPTLQVGITEFVAWINKMREAAIQDEVWTEELQNAYRDALLNADLQPFEIPDDPPIT